MYNCIVCQQGNAEIRDIGGSTIAIHPICFRNTCLNCPDCGRLAIGYSGKQVRCYNCEQKMQQAQELASKKFHDEHPELYKFCTQCHREYMIDSEYGYGDDD